MTKPTLFLDIDGVLHGVNDANLDPEDNKAKGNIFRWGIRFADLMSEFPNVQVVLHSSWRLVWNTNEELFQNIPEHISKLIVDTTGRDVMGRYESIEAYRAKHGITKFVIVDDDRKAFPWKLPEFVWCKSDRGISDPVTFQKLKDKLTQINKE